MQEIELNTHRQERLRVCQICGKPLSESAITHEIPEIRITECCDTCYENYDLFMSAMDKDEQAQAWFEKVTKNKNEMRMSIIIFGLSIMAAVINWSSYGFGCRAGIIMACLAAVAGCLTARLLLKKLALNKQFNEITERVYMQIAIMDDSGTEHQ